MTKLELLQLIQEEVIKCQTELDGSRGTLLRHNTLVQVGTMYLCVTDGKASITGSPINASWFEKERATRIAPEISNGNGDIGKPIFYRTALEDYIESHNRTIAFLAQAETDV